MANTLVDFTQPLGFGIQVLTDASERAAGRSHGDISFQNGITKHKHYFFSHLSPQPNGAAFSSFKINQPMDLSDTSHLGLVVENLSDKATQYQLIFDTNASAGMPFSYQVSFNLSPHEHRTIHVNLADVTATKRGKTYPQAPQFDRATIQAIGFRVIGRAGDDAQSYQSGLYGLAIEKIVSYATAP